MSTASGDIGNLTLVLLGMLGISHMQSLLPLTPAIELSSGTSLDIQNALNDLEARGGGTLRLRNGEYKLHANGEYSVYVPSNVMMEGESRDGTVLKLVEEPTRGIFQTKGWLWNPPWTPTRNISFRRLTIDIGSPVGFYREYPPGDIWQDFFVITGNTSGLLIDDVSFIQRNPGDVISRLFLWQCNNIGITNCSFEGVAVWVFSNQTITGRPHLVTESGFLYQDNVANNISTHMAVGGDMIGFTARRNVITGCRGSAIDTGISPDAVVEDNDVDGAVGTGIYSEAGERVTIRRNIVRNVTYRDPSVPWDGRGIQTSDARHARYPGNVLIEDNEITNCGNGIASRGKRNVTIQNNLISSMGSKGVEISWHGQGGLHYDGELSYADGCIVRNNTIEDFGKSVAWSRGVMLVNVRDCLVENNIIDGFGNIHASQGIGEYYSRILRCPTSGWLFDQYSAADCDVPVEEIVSPDRPDFNTISENAISGVGTDIAVIGPNTIVV